MRAFWLRILTFLHLFVTVNAFFEVRASLPYYSVSGKVPEENYSLRLSDGNHCRVVINEIMVDPTPVVGLPAHEWIELLNAGSCRVNLSGWKIIVGTTSRTLSEAWLDPGEYIIVCTPAAATELGHWGTTLSVSLPALRNTGNLIQLTDAGGVEYDAVHYVDTWYKDTMKKNGGWTLERIDPLRNCGEAANWTASSNPEGGTPGAQNSVYADNTDNDAPELLWAGAVSVASVALYFSEAMNAESLKNPGNYRLSGGVGFPDTVAVPDESTVILGWEIPLEVNKTYLLYLENISDACSNILDAGPVKIEWVVLEPADVVVNEVLFNPWPGGVDFVEIHNRSGKRIDAGKITLAGRDRNLNLRQHISLRSIGRVIEPGEYIALCISPESVLSYYSTPCEECIFRLPSMPAYNNDEGWVVLLDEQQNIIDEFHYTDKMHHRLLHDVKGVSLERVNPELPASQPGNRQSASADAGYATPGYRNSQFQSGPLQQASVAIESLAISPNGDGYNDELVIHYETPMPGWIANSWIFDVSGRTVARLMKNQLLSVNGSLKWDGSDETGSRLMAGPYILFMEMYDLNGNIERFRKAVVITERWD
jgi:hypothetical protein